MKVSVAMTTYNGEYFLEDQIYSILNQLNHDDELIVSDDGSTDSTFNILEKIQSNDSRLHVVRGPQNGVVKNFENAISECTGDIIFLSDQDDIWYKNKVSDIKEILLNNKNIELIMHNSNKIIENKYIQDKLIKRYKPGVLRNMLFSSYWGCCMVFTKELSELILPFPDNLVAHDQWIGLIGELRKSSFFYDKELIWHRYHSNNVSKKSNFLNAIQFRFNLLLNLILRKQK